MKTIEELGVSPWPWKATQSGLVMKADVRPRDNEMVAVCCGCYEIDANARLIAAAPELYEALVDLVKLHEDCSQHDCDECPRCLGNGRKCDIEEDELLEAAYRAIAKADGKEESK